MLLDSLKVYEPTNAEQKHYADILGLIEHHADCFYRTHFNPGHITGSALLLSYDESRVLMNHHKFLDMWICFGGHADGEQNILNVARREVMEESGIKEIEPVVESIFDVDVHAIPPNLKKNEPEHKHFDIRYLFRVRNKESEIFIQSDESHDLRWCDYTQAKALALPKDISMHRLLDKWHGFACAKGTKQIQQPYQTAKG